MPVEITMALTPLEQAVADARKNQQIMEAKVEDAKLALKAAKTAWEESVGALNLAVDEMIRDKRQPSLPFDVDDDASATGGPKDPNPAGGGGQPVAAEPVPTVVTIVPTAVAIREPDVLDVPVSALLGLPAADAAPGPSWRSLVVAEHLDGPGTLFDTLSLFKVETLGQLADALQAGRTFNLSRDQVHELFEAIEDVSQEDEAPLKFDRESVVVTVKEVSAEGEEPATKKGRAKRGKKSKESAGSAESSGSVGQPEAAEPAPVPASGLDDL